MMSDELGVGSGAVELSAMGETDRKAVVFMDFSGKEWKKATKKIATPTCQELGWLCNHVHNLRTVCAVWGLAGGDCW